MELVDKFKEAMKWLNDNQWLNVIFLLLAILGIILSVYLYRKSKKKKKPFFSIRSVNIVSDSIHSLGNIQVTFHGSAVESLTVTKIAIWNSGNDTLNSADQAPTDKLRIESAEGVQIFKADVIYESNITNNFKAIIATNKVEVTFDYFDQNEGGIIKIIHSGKSSDDLKILGTFKGAGIIQKVNTSSLASIFPKFLAPFRKATEKEKRLMVKIIPKIILVVGLFVATLPLYVNTRDEQTSMDALFLITGGLYLVLGLILIFSANTLPKGFETFYGDE